MSRFNLFFSIFLLLFFTAVVANNASAAAEYDSSSVVHRIRKLGFSYGTGFHYEYHAKMAGSAYSWESYNSIGLRSFLQWRYIGSSASVGRTYKDSRMSSDSPFMNIELFIAPSFLRAEYMHKETWFWCSDWHPSLEFLFGRNVWRGTGYEYVGFRARDVFPLPLIHHIFDQTFELKARNNGYWIGGTSLIFDF